METAEIHQTIQKQRNFFSGLHTIGIDFRLQMLKRLRATIHEYEGKVVEALYDDLRKSPFEAYMTDIGFVKEELNHHLKHLRSWAKPRRVKTPLAHFHSTSFIHSEPYGVVLIIAPWNYPFNLLFVPLIGAISAGNCVVLKPSNYSPNTSAAMAEMIKKTFNGEYISICQGGREMNQALLAEKFDHIFFTGSPSLGKIVMEAASKYLTPVTLELGGKSPCIVDREAKIGLAARRIVWGKFLNAGQTCVAPDYLLVDRTVKNNLIDALKEWIKHFFGKDPEESPDFSRIVNDRHFERLCGLMDKGTIIFGGKTRREKKYIGPTIIDGIKPDDPIMQEEIFGPLFPVLEYEDLREAIAFVNSRPEPLALYFFSQNRRKQSTVLRQVSFGGGCINDTMVHFANPYLPFGGLGNSGMGSYHGKASFDTFSHKKSILRKSNWLDVKVRYAPYKGKIKQLKTLLKWCS
ncbi:MAG: aldehyde dehydrogenase family protein [Proteobacteria bacterium]|nr:aldehyde dehydrogenase family protein [Pseudomonadota bacterium]